MILSQQLSQHIHNLDDLEIRSLYRASISLSAMKSLAGLELIALELDILSRAPRPSDKPQPPADERSQGRNNPTDTYSDKVDINVNSAIKGGALLSSDGKPLRPFTLLDSRERLKAGVFKSGHNLPTMTIDEYLEEERRRGGIIEGGGCVLFFLAVNI